MNWDNYKSIIQEVDLPILKQKNIKLSVLREDLIHPKISGNKFRKLKYNFAEAERLGYKKVITFGGAFSNHIAATAAAAKLNNFEAIGFIRGEEIEALIEQNPTLKFAQEEGMKFNFISREDYRLKDSEKFLNQLKIEFPDHYIIPEGGTNDLAIKGCEEILNDSCFEYDFITTAIGTAGTITGIINSTSKNQHVLGFPALKSKHFDEEIRKLAKKINYTIIDNYHFGGYAKVSEELINFINSFKETTSIPLDPIYTAKMMFGILDLIQKDYFKPNISILAVHTGGLQGIDGMNKLLNKKNKTLIQ
ncbi:1-aminocyclopropane-1-carboxylate deaminase/D-cysteine desulfhydrase [Faecalibacter bovis]|uniref:Pyridoxal-phosphate dependent enzyme n=1 Tax=Faecalibacter bovis TaxID=2898187 RepID=A0ABX7XB79_9FLAO|nr:pyridoxal-phosphate dependent enzyme [Faecalibacter bovis]QTV05163.1 pyridoxal-phosphate dependent enzyme [Faecalibacter bovis]